MELHRTRVEVELRLEEGKTRLRLASDEILYDLKLVDVIQKLTQLPFDD